MSKTVLRDVLVIHNSRIRSLEFLEEDADFVAVRRTRCVEKKARRHDGVDNERTWDE